MADAVPSSDIVAGGWSAASPRARPILERVGYGDGTFACSHAQARLWRDYLLRSAHGGTQAIYHSLLPIHFKGALDISALERTLYEVLCRHESLRCRVESREGIPVMRPMPPEPLKLARVALKLQRQESVATAIARHMDEFVSRKFDISRDPMMRVELLGIDDNEHALLVIAHHLASDGWSMDLLYDEIVQGYRADRHGEPWPFKSLPYQYTDYVGWEASRFNTASFNHSVTYWTKQFDGAPHALQLPLDRPRPEHMFRYGACYEIELPHDHVCASRLLAAERAGSEFQWHLALVALVLSRWTGQLDLVVGTPSANRSLPETEPMIGLFSTLLPLRLRIDEFAGFESLFAQVRDKLLDAFEHQEVPLETFASRLHEPDGMGTMPFLQALVIHTQRGTPIEVVQGGEQVQVQVLPYKYDCTVHTDLTFLVHHEPDRTTLSILYATEIFDSASIAQLAEQYAAVLAEAVRAPAKQLFTMSVMGAEEVARIVAFEQGSPVTPAKQIGERFLAMAAAHPSRTALVTGTRTLDYATLAAAACRVAAALEGIADEPGSLVAVCLPRDIERVVAILGVILAGRAFLPLDIAFPEAQLSYLVADSGAQIVIGDLNSLVQFEALPISAQLDVEDLMNYGGRNSVDILTQVAETETEALAYVIYTSGSTGKPKGVDVTHRGIANFVDWYIRTFAIGPEDRLVQLASPNFDASVLDTLPALCAGASLYIGPDSWRHDPDQLWRHMAEQDVTVAFLTTPLFNAAAKSAYLTKSRLRAVQVGGDILQAPNRVLPFTLHDLYGPTEITIAITAGIVTSTTPANIGRPIDGMTARVLDAQLRRVPIGTVGELFGAGAGLARGYRNRPGLTASRFIVDPYSDLPAARMYRTGDRVRWTASGVIEFLGRDDDQVKIRGYRIELREVEAALLENCTVAEAVVLTHVHSDQRLGLTAYVRLSDAATTETLSAWLATRLPTWMIPERLVVVDRFPLTPNGKIDRAALPAVGFNLSDVGTQSRRRPEGPVEELVAQIWSELLGVSEISAEDNFFKLGGHSLLAGRLLFRVSQRTGCEITFSLVFDHPILTDFAREVENRILTMLASH
jgi:amino acid adenylation domain-containing protein